MYSIVVLCGSLREDSSTRKALQVACEGVRKLGVEPQWADLRLPLFVEGVSREDPAAQRFRELVRGADGLLVGTPVYHDSYSGVLKNGIDHLYHELTDKVAAVVAVGGGRVGQGQALEHLRATLRETSTWVLPRQAVVPRAAEAFDEAGALKEPELQVRLQQLGTELVLRCRQLRPKKAAAPPAAARG